MRAMRRTEAAAKKAGEESGAAEAFKAETSGRRLAVQAPSLVMRSARARRAGHIDSRRGRDHRAPRLSDWG